MSYLEPYRVLDLTDWRGAMSGRILADLGADVVAVEQPEAKRVSYSDDADAESNLARLVYAFNKRSITCDRYTEEGRALLRSLCQHVDIVLISGSKSQIASLGLDHDELAAANPGLITVVSSPFGLESRGSEYEDTDLILWAAAGLLSRNRFFGRAPNRIGAANQAYYHGAAEAVVGALLALYERHDSGRGQRVDISFQNSFVFANQLQGLYPLVNDVAAPAGKDASIFPLIWQGAEGYVHFSLTSGPSTGHFSNAFLAWLKEEVGLPEALADIDFRKLPQTSGSGQSSVGDTQRRYAEIGFGEDKQKMLEDCIAAFFVTKSHSELFAAAVERRLLVSPILDIEQVTQNEQLAERDAWVEGVDANGKPYKLPGNFAKTIPDAFITPRGVPAPGSANADVYGALVGLSEPELAALSEKGVI